MPRLHELQRAFAAAIVEGKGLTATTSMRVGPVWRSLALYRRLIRNNYVQALTMTYPMLRRLIGGRYFNTFARGYLKRYPSKSGDLFGYGRHFPLFLLQLESPRLLVELARLEWACHEVSQAADTSPFALSQFDVLTSCRSGMCEGSSPTNRPVVAVLVPRPCRVAGPAAREHRSRRDRPAVA
jgi:hypothetical protein